MMSKGMFGVRPLLAVLLVAFQVITTSGTHFTILHTTDIHGWLDAHPHNSTLNADFGDFHSLVLHLRAQAQKAGIEFLMFDSGDIIEGTGLSDATAVHGQYIFPVFLNVMNYDALTIGNHDIGHSNSVSLMEKSFIPQWNGHYLTANSEAESTQAPLGEPYIVLTTALGHKVLVLGYLFNFTHEANTTNVVPVSVSLTQKYFSTAMAVPNIDVIVVVAHIAPQSPPELKQIYTAIRAAHPSTPLVMCSGHSHVTDFVQFDDNGFTIESGKYFEVIGLVDFDLGTDGSMQNLKHQWWETSLDNFYKLSSTTAATFDTPAGLQTTALIQKYSQMLGLNTTYGCAPKTYYVDASFSYSDSLYNLLVNEIVPKTLFSSLPNKNTPFYVTNTASLRYNLFAGPVTRNDIYTLSPFNDTYAVFSGMDGASLQQFVNALKSSMAQYSGHRCSDPRMYLPSWVTSTTTISPSVTYDVVLSEYDSVTLQPLVKKLFPNKPFNQPKPYDSEYNGTGAIQTYVERYFKCS